MAQPFATHAPGMAMHAGAHGMGPGHPGAQGMPGGPPQPGVSLPQQMHGGVMPGAPIQGMIPGIIPSGMPGGPSAHAQAHLNPAQQAGLVPQHPQMQHMSEFWSPPTSCVVDKASSRMA